MTSTAKANVNTSAIWNALNVDKDDDVNEIAPRDRSFISGPSPCRVTFNEANMTRDKFDAHLLKALGATRVAEIERHAEEQTEKKTSVLGIIGRCVASVFCAIFGLAYTVCSPLVAIACIPLGFFTQGASWNFVTSNDVWSWGLEPVKFVWDDIPSDEELRADIADRIGGGCAEEWPVLAYIPEGHYVDVRKTTDAQKGVIAGYDLDMNHNGAVEDGTESRRIDAALNNPLAALDKPVLRSLRMSREPELPAVLPLVSSTFENNVLKHNPYDARELRSIMQMLSPLDAAARAYLFERVIMVHGFNYSMLDVPGMDDPAFVPYLQKLTLVENNLDSSKLMDHLHYSFAQREAVIAARDGWVQLYMMQELMTLAEGKAKYALPPQEFNKWASQFNDETVKWLQGQYVERSFPTR